MSRFVNINFRILVFNTHIAEKLNPQSCEVTCDTQPIRYKAIKFEKWLDFPQLFLNFDQVVKRLLRLKRLIRLFISKCVNFHDAFNILLKLINFEIQWTWLLWTANWIYQFWIMSCLDSISFFCFVLQQRRTLNWAVPLRVLWTCNWQKAVIFRKRFYLMGLDLW